LSDEKKKKKISTKAAYVETQQKYYYNVIIYITVFSHLPRKKMNEEKSRKDCF
jgi:hypothetical protein